MDLPDLLAWPRRAEVPSLVFRRLLTRQAVHGLDALSRPEQVLWLVFELCEEVASGGAAEFFAQSSGERAPLMPAALRELGDAAVAVALERCLAHVTAGKKPRASARPHLEALERAVTSAHDGLMRSLVDWFHRNAQQFTLTNAGLAAFRPVSVSEKTSVADLLASDLAPDALLPSLYVCWARAGQQLSAPELALQRAVQAFGEISDEGGFSYLFCERAREAPEARAALESAGAAEAGAIVGRVMAVLPAPYPADTTLRRAALASLGEDALTRLQALQWEMDALRGPTLDSLAAAARGRFSPPR